MKKGRVIRVEVPQNMEVGNCSDLQWNHLLTMRRGLMIRVNNFKIPFCQSRSHALKWLLLFLGFFHRF